MFFPSGEVYIIFMIVDGKQIASHIEEELKKKIEELKKKNIIPKLVVVLVGDDQASKTYVRKKEESARRIGLDFSLQKFPTDIMQAELLDKIQEIQKDKVSGLMVQLPLPDHLNSNEIINRINQEIDVDCLTENNWGKLVQGESLFEPPTAGAMLEIIKNHKIDLEGKEVVIIGKGELVGKPLALMLMQEDCTVTVCHIKTRDLAFHTKRADIIFSGVGKCNLLTDEMVKEGAVIIDAGVSFNDDGKICGDVDFDSVSKKASLITPTPGGVGPLTVIKLIENTVKASVALYQNNK